MNAADIAREWFRFGALLGFVIGFAMAAVLLDWLNNRNRKGGT